MTSIMLGVESLIAAGLLVAVVVLARALDSARRRAAELQQDLAREHDNAIELARNLHSYVRRSSIPLDPYPESLLERLRAEYRADDAKRLATARAQWAPHVRLDGTDAAGPAGSVP